MTPFRLIYDNVVDRATLTSSTSASASLSVANVKTHIKSQIWRSAAAAGGVAANGWIKADFVSGEKIAGLGLAFTNMSPQTLVRFRGTDEAAATNVLLYSSTFTNAAWVPANITVSGGALTDPSGGATAFTLTATGSGGKQFRQTVTAGASAICCNSIWMRRRTGTGNINLWSTDTAVPLVISGMSATWTRYSVANVAPSTARGFLIEMVAAGDAIDVWGGQMESGPTPTSYYPTTSAAATRPVGFMDNWQSYLFDTGYVLAVPDLGVSTPGWGGVNSFAYGGASSGSIWLDSQPSGLRAARVDINDPGNLGGSVEIGRLFIGSYWQGVKNVDWGSALAIEDTSKQERTDSGDLVAEVGTINRKLNLPLSDMGAADRAALFNLNFRNGKVRPVFIDLFPEHTDGALAQSHMGCFTLQETASMAMPNYLQYASSLVLVEN